MAVMQNTFRKRVKLRLLVISASCLVVFAVLGSSVLAIARGYTTEDKGLQTGMVVSLTTQGGDEQVERATQDSSSRVVGVITTIEGSLVTVSSGTAQVLVESEGQVDVYVSDINGTVEKGDLLILSPLKGILMKASPNSTSKIIGIAAQAVGQTSSYEFQDVDQTKQTQIAKIKIDLSYLGGANSGISISDSALAKLGKAVVGRDVGEIRVVIALIIFVIVLIAEGSILYGAISNAITALGRNPLARKIIRAELFRVILVAIVVLLVGLASVYAVLWV
jgi:hypothetical protein